MTQEEKATVIDRASKQFQEWLYYMKESGTKFNLAPREDLDGAITHWNAIFCENLENDLKEL